jgi:toxin ParE1/3/4
VTHRVVLTERALEDLQSLFDYVARHSDFATAEAYDRRIREACRSLSEYPRRGSPRDDLLPGLRTLSFERRGIIAYQVEGLLVRIIAILHHGRDFGLAFEG